MDGIGNPVLEVRGLSTSFFTDDGEVKAVRDVSFDLAAGRPSASSVSRGAARASPPSPSSGWCHGRARVVGGEILFKGRDLLSIDREELRQIRGRDIAMIFQDPLSSLNPVHRIGAQVEEAMRAHDKVASAGGEAARPGAARQVRMCPTPAGASATTRTSSPAACASG
jgi:ABC-type dipeptide/oligopeptide/nickel transport system ATPase component